MLRSCTCAGAVGVGASAKFWFHMVSKKRSTSTNVAQEHVFSQTHFFSEMSGCYFVADRESPETFKESKLFHMKLFFFNDFNDLQFLQKSSNAH